MPGDVRRRTGIWVGALFGATLLVGCTDRSVSTAEVAARWSAGQHRMHVLQGRPQAASLASDVALRSGTSVSAASEVALVESRSRAQTRSDELLAAIEDRTPVA